MLIKDSRNSDNVEQPIHKGIQNNQVATGNPLLKHKQICAL